jgi:cell division protein FtsB
MLGFHEKRRLARLFYSRGSMIALLVLIGVGIYAAASAREMQIRATEKRAELSDELGRLEERASALEEDIVHLEDPRGIEAELRRRYDVAKEGEEVVVLVEDPEEVEAATSTPAEAKPESIFERLGGGAD